MFTYFHDRKFKYEKGQLAPVYILILVIVIIMAMVTVNLSKVAMVKTDTANSADAGALATGAIMANAFNGVAIQNNLMMNAYWSAYMSIALAFILTFRKLIMAYMTASAALTAASTNALALQPPCATSCAALAAIRTTYIPLDSAVLNLAWVIKSIAAIGVSITGLWIAQQFNYQIIRRMAVRGRSSAIRNGHGFVFSNSEIGSKLKAGSMPSGVTKDPQGYRDAYVNFLDGIGDNEHYNYSWRDGQERLHSVDSNVYTKKVDDFKLTVTLLSFGEEFAATVASIASVMLAKSSLIAAKAAYLTAGIYFDAACLQVPCCICPYPVCCPSCTASAVSGKMALIPGIAENSAALLAMTGTFVLLVTALAGLLPVRETTSSGEWDVPLEIVCWISDIDHDHLVRVDTIQSHQGADLGLWKTSYPTTSSYAVVDFAGRGSIDPPNPRYGSDIVAVDSN
jgi:hypothetical protein